MICEKCGFEYEGENCPVCAAADTVEVTEAPAKKGPLGIIGMVLGIVGLAMFVFGAGGNITATAALSYLAFFLIPGYIIGAIPSIAGMVISCIALKAAPADKFAKLGKTFSLIGIIIKVACIVLCIAYAILMACLSLIGNILLIITNAITQ